MATLNLYHTDSVAATLLYGLHTGKPKLAIQTAKELYVSGEINFLWRILTFAWLLSDPDNLCESDRYMALCEEDCEYFLYSLLSDTSVKIPPLPSIDFLPRPRYEKQIHAKWNHIPEGWTEGHVGSLVLAIRDTLQHKQWKRAVFLTAPLLEKHTPFVCELFSFFDIHPLFQTMLETTIYIPLCVQILSHAYATCSRDSSENQRVNNAWKMLWNTSTGRTFTISHEALAIWHISHKSINEMIGSPIWVANDDASSVWKNALTKYGVTVKKSEFLFSDPNKIDEFYSVYFPNDIPDEWPQTEREKSHGATVEHIPNPWTPAFVLCNG
jgi:hypothetical protein